IQAHEDGYYLVDCSANIREINRELNWKLPSEGPKTLNGLLLENLEYIPKAGTTLKIDNYLVEITQVSESAIKIARIKTIEKSPKDTNT
ncbi:MAG: transporter associated domain-containing protein, partial [Pseudomonadota bacterium]|nr:transporter associated domain-containing protein [Pseudomonadota bacterium]